MVCFSCGVFELYRTQTLEKLHTGNLSLCRINSVAFHSSGDWIVMGCAKSGQIYVWDRHTKTYIFKTKEPNSNVTEIAYSPDGLYLATGTADGKVNLWDNRTGLCSATFSYHHTPVTAVCFLPAPNQGIVWSSLDGIVHIVDFIGYKHHTTLSNSYSTPISYVTVDPTGEIICAASKTTHHILVLSRLN
jgi:periodic tryptophan protein 2